MYSKELFIIGVYKNRNDVIRTAMTFIPKLKLIFLSFAYKYFKRTINTNRNTVTNKHKILIK